MGKTVNIGGRIHNPEVGNVVAGANEILDDTKGKKQNVINSEVDTALAGLGSGKQDKLTFDHTPTENSTNPVTSGGVYAADQVLQQAIEAILLLIPSAASALNQLADKSFVNSSIATASATFRGTYNLVSDLHLSVSASHQDIATALASVVATADNNDYCFVQIPTSDTSSDIRVTERYKFNGTDWSYEYDLNNSGFTAQQWEAINSGITALLVTKLGALPTAAELATLLAGKQATLTFDSTPTPGSANPVTSGGLYDKFEAIIAKIPSDASANNKLVAENRLAAYVTAIIEALDASFDLTSADGHVTFRMTQTNGIIASVQILTSDIASAQALTTLGGQVSTNASDIAALQDLYNALQQSAPEIIEPTDTWPVANPSDTVIYRVIDRENTPPEYYSDYMFKASDLTTPVLMATYNNAIDPRPKKGSANLVTSGGVFDNIGALDISELNATGGTLTPYATLDAALAAIPSDYQKGGMSIKFVQTSDNKYMQYRSISTSFSTNIADWKEIDSHEQLELGELIEGQYVLSTNGTFSSYADYYRTDFIYVGGLKKIKVYIGVHKNNVGFAFYSSNSTSSYISGINSNDYTLGDIVVINVPDNAKYATFCAYTEEQAERLFVAVPNVANAIVELNDEIDGDIFEVNNRLDLEVGMNYTETGSSLHYQDICVPQGSNSKIRLVSGSNVKIYTESNGVSGYIQQGTLLEVGDEITLNTTNQIDRIAIYPLGSSQNNTCVVYRIGGTKDSIYVLDAEISDKISEKMEYNLGTLQNGFIVYDDGRFVAADSYRATDYIKIVGSKIQFPIYFKDTAGIAFYDSDKDYISGWNNTQGTADYGKVIVVNIPQNAAYIRICWLATYIESAFLLCADTSIIPILQESVNGPVPVINPCFYKESSGCRTFKKILCIGDSLTSGTFEYRDGGDTLHYFEDATLSYPTFLKCLTGRDTTNKGDGGQTTKSWWEIHQNDDLSGHDACIIALGRNDYSQGRETTTEERYEYMGYIINKVRTENPQIKVFVATMLNYYTGANADSVNADMRGIATQNNCYLVDISAYGKLTFDNDAYSHLTAEGYEKVANYYFNYISYIMAQNPADFKNIQFIGTEHYY